MSCIRCDAESKEPLCPSCAGAMSKEDPFWQYPWTVTGLDTSLVSVMDQEMRGSIDGTLFSQQVSWDAIRYVERMASRREGGKEERESISRAVDKQLFMMGVPRDIDMHFRMVFSEEDLKLLSQVFARMEEGVLAEIPELCTRMGTALWHIATGIKDSSSAKSVELFGKSLKYLLKARELSEDKTICRNIAIVFYSTNDFNDCLEYCHKASELGDAQLCEVEGLCLAALGDVDEAIGRLDAASKLKPGEPGVLVELGRLLARKGRIREALGRVEAALAIDPDLERAQALKVELQGREGRKEAKPSESRERAVPAPPPKEKPGTDKGGVPGAPMDIIEMLSGSERKWSSESKGVEASTKEYEREWRRFKEWMNTQTESISRLMRKLEEGEKALARREEALRALEKRISDDMARKVSIAEPAERKEVPAAPRPGPEPTKEQVKKKREVRARERGAETVQPKAEPLKVEPEGVKDRTESSDQLDALLSKTELLLRDRRFEEALSSLDEASRLGTGRIDILASKASALEGLERYDEALGYYARILESKQKDEGALRSKINVLKKLGRFEDALDVYDALAESSGKKEEVMVEKGKLLISLGMSDEAALCFNSVIEKRPNDKQAHIYLGDVMMQTGRLDEAYQCYNKAAELDPRDADAWFRRGLIHDKKGKWGAAVQFFNWAIALRQDFIEAWLNKAEIVEEHGELKEALESYNRVTRLDKKNERAWYGKAKALWEMGRHQEALKCVQILLDLSPKSDMALKIRARIVERLKEKKEESARNETYIMVKAGDLYREGRSRDALKLYALASKLNPGNETAHVRTADILSRGNNTSRAMKKYMQVLSINPRNEGALLGKGLLHMRLEQYNDAVACFEGLLKQNPKDNKAKNYRDECIRRSKVKR